MAYGWLGVGQKVIMVSPEILVQIFVVSKDIVYIFIFMSHNSPYNTLDSKFKPCLDTLTTAISYQELSLSTLMSPHSA